MDATKTQVSTEKMKTESGSKKAGRSGIEAMAYPVARTTAPTAPIRAKVIKATTPPAAVGGISSARRRIRRRARPCRSQAQTFSSKPNLTHWPEYAPVVAAATVPTPKSNGTSQGMRPRPWVPGSRCSRTSVRWRYLSGWLKLVTEGYSASSCRR